MMKYRMKPPSSKTVSSQNGQQQYRLAGPSSGRVVDHQDSISSSMQSSETTGSTSKHKRSHDPRNNRRSLTTKQVCTAKIVFIIILTGVAVLAAYFSYTQTAGQEMKLARAQFSAIANRAVEGAVGVVHRKRHTTLTMANILSEEFPNATAWPFVYLPGYQRIATSLAQSGSHEHMGYVPIVSLEQQAEFESFAYNYFYNIRRPKLPNDTALYPFGRGIWRPNRTAVGGKSHDNDIDIHKKRSKNPIIVPLFHAIEKSNDQRENIRLFNFFSEPIRRKTIEDIRECANYTTNYNIINNSSSLASTTLSIQDECNKMSDFVVLKRWINRGPASLILQPVSVPSSSREEVSSTSDASSSDTTTDTTEEVLTGFVVSPILWDEIFQNQFSKDVKKVHCVLRSDTATHTFTIVDGQIDSFEPGDLHQRKYDHLGYYKELTANYGNKLSSPNFNATTTKTTNYNLYVYPTDEFFEFYTTANPRNVTIGSILIIFFTTFFFWVYDYFVRKSFQERTELLEAKRKFMRYVSHEVRTPLNAVCMGLNVIQTELGEYIKEAMISLKSKNDDQAPDDKEKNEGPSWYKKGLDCLELVEEIQISAQSAVDVLNDVLNYDKIEHSSLRLEMTMIPIWRFLGRTFSEFELPAAKKHLHLKLLYAGKQQQQQQQQQQQDGSVTTGNGDDTCSEDATMVSTEQEVPDELQDLLLAGDPSRMAQILRNLLSNAIKFTPAHGSIVVKSMYVPPSSSSEQQSEEDKSIIGGNKTILGTKSKNQKVESIIELADGSRCVVEKSGHLRVTVQDTGAGLSHDQITKLFEEGVQFNANKLQAGGGSGLGLYITKGLVEQHHGSLSATSDGLGKGSTFTLCLPLYRDPNSIDVTYQTEGTISSFTLKNEPLSSVEEVEEEPTETPSKMGMMDDGGSFSGKNSFVTTTTTAKTLRLLIVDDALSNRKLLARLLSKKGHHCDMAEDGKVAVAMIQKAMALSSEERELQDKGDNDEENQHCQEVMDVSQQMYDCILIDYEMPVLNGPLACKEIRQTLGSDVFIIGVTGNMLTEDVKYFEANGANVVLPKPVQIHAIEEAWLEYGLVDATTTTATY